MNLDISCLKVFLNLTTFPSGLMNLETWDAKWPSISTQLSWIVSFTENELPPGLYSVTLRLFNKVSDFTSFTEVLIIQDLSNVTVTSSYGEFIPTCYLFLGAGFQVCKHVCDCFTHLSNLCILGNRSTFMHQYIYIFLSRAHSITVN